MRAIRNPRLVARERAAATRIGGLDVARGLAVIGMFGAHFRIAGELSTDPSTWGGVVDGRSSILFATLAGVSIALLSGRDRPVDGVELARARLRIAVRAAWVFAIGGVLEWLDTFVLIILPAYGVLFVLALPFLRWPPRRLLIGAGVIAVVGPPVNLYLGQLLSEGGVDERPFAQLMVTGPYPAMLWLAFVLVGLAVGRLDLGSAAVRSRLAIAGATAAVLGYGGGWVTTRAWIDGGTAFGPAAGYASPPGGWDAGWMAGAEPHTGTTFELVGSTGFAVLVIAGCLVLADLLPRVIAPLAAVGSMALTVYTVQVVALWALWSVDPEATQGVGVWLIFVLCALVLATAWRATIGRGPLERLLAWSSSRAAAIGPVDRT